MNFHFEIKEYNLRFKFEAGTSRGVLHEKKSWFLKITDPYGITGIGEANPLKGLSPEFDTMDEHIQKFKSWLSDQTYEGLLNTDLSGNTNLCSSLLFALETSLLDLKNGGKRIIFPGPFVDGSLSIPINGLIWMGKKDFMVEQIRKKISEGYSCIKLKIGAMDFDVECEILSWLRQTFGKELMLRVDANGAFKPEEAIEKLVRLSAFNIHSIEQPIKEGQWESMQSLCKNSPVRIALDEELIGVKSIDEKIRILDNIKPHAIILKPSLAGGIFHCEEWIKLAEERKIEWWVTSALESNIGLNSIAQFTAKFPQALHIPQGLGTGQLYVNNIESPLVIKAGTLITDPHLSWDLSQI